MYLPLPKKKSFLDDLTLALFCGALMAGVSYVAYQIFRPTETPGYSSVAPSEANELEKKLEKVETALPQGAMTVGEIEDYLIGGVNYSIQTGVDYDDHQPFIRISATSHGPNLTLKPIKSPLRKGLRIKLSKDLIFQVTGVEEKEVSHAAPIGYGNKDDSPEKETQFKFKFSKNY